MKIRIIPIFGVLIFLVAHSVIPFVTKWREGQIIFNRAKDFGQPPPMLFLETMIGPIVVSFLITSLMFWLVKRRLSEKLLGCAFLFSILYGTVVLIISPKIGRPLDYHFLEGFAEGVGKVETDKMISWADQTVFNIANDSSHTNLSPTAPDEIPPFFGPIFPIQQNLTAQIIAAKDGTPLLLGVEAEDGLQWGIWISRASDAPDPVLMAELHFPSLKYLRRTDRIYVYIYRYK